MKRQLTLYLILLCSVSCIVHKKSTSRGKFITFEHGGWDNLNTMIKRVHEQRWTIHYSYGDNCPAEKRNNDAALTAAISKALQTWLQPLRDYAQKPLVNDFRYQLNSDWNAADFGIIFHCDIGGGSRAPILTDKAPGIIMQKGTQVVEHFMATLLHEMGHIFGLADTYVPRANRGKPGLSKGGLDATKGTQPASRMSGYSKRRDGNVELLGKDDKNGIVWLYKHIYENQPLKDCFFPDYEFEDSPTGCRPKYPLIFELKHGSNVNNGWLAGRIIEEDESLDVNAQDSHGMTALHYAVLYELDEVVEKLLAHQDIKPFLRNEQGHSALRLARDNKLERMVALLLAHPLTLPVNAKGKKAVTWGEIKRGDN